MTTPPPLPRTPDKNVRKDMPVMAWTGSWGTTSIQQALDNHDLGQFLLSAQLSESVQRDDRVATALNTRCKGLLGLPREITPSPRGDRRKAKTAAKDLETLWAETDLTESLIQILRWQVMMGFAVAEIVWSGDAEAWTFSLKVWHPQFLWFNWATRQYMLNTSDGPVVVTPGDGKWLMLTPEGEYRAWIQGAVRSIAIPWLGRQYAFRDWMRFNEIYGLPIRKATVPAQTSEEDKIGFFQDIRDAGSAMVVSCPTGTDGQKYDIELVEATATGWETFRNATEDADKRITLALLGQNLTTEVSGGSYAAAKVHGQVRQDYLEADERGLVAGFRRQVLRAWAAFNYGDPDLAPVLRFDVEPPDDGKLKADTLVSLSTALLNLAAVAPEVDRRALLASYNLPLHEPGEEPPPLVVAPPGAPPAPAAPPPAADAPVDPSAEVASRHALGRFDHIDFSPPDGVRAEAQRGLDWRDEYGRGGTEVGVARARDLSNGRNVSPDTARRMASYFARHEADKSGEGWSPGEDGYPSAGRIAWALWGGDPGRAWADKLTKQMESAETASRHVHALAVRAPAPAVEAGAFVEDVGSIARDRAAKAMAPTVQAVLSSLDGAKSYDEIRAALALAATDLDPTELAQVTEHALVLSQLAGRRAVRALETHDEPR